MSHIFLCKTSSLNIKYVVLFVRPVKVCLEFLILNFFLRRFITPVYIGHHISAVSVSLSLSPHVRLTRTFHSTFFLSFR